MSDSRAGQQDEWVACRRGWSARRWSRGRCRDGTTS